jgi:2-polyprenyl-3-methyl-5-hydroxy-6-metoxy-1,4-benzoquinol methylase
MAPQAYEMQTYRSPNPLSRFAHASRFGLSSTIASGYLPPKGTLLDYGAGDGHFLKELHRTRSDAALFGLEPYMENFADDDAAYTGYRSAQDAETRRYDVITCFEVLEHLDEKETDFFLGFVERALAPGGRLVVSVPIMYGPVLVPKALNAKYVKKSDWSYSIFEMVRAVLLMDVPRDPGGLYLNHKGYDWRKTRTRLGANFTAVEHRFSPFSALWWGFNSQWFGVFAKS